MLRLQLVFGSWMLPFAAPAMDVDVRTSACYNKCTLKIGGHYAVPGKQTHGRLKVKFQPGKPTPMWIITNSCHDEYHRCYTLEYEDSNYMRWSLSKSGYLFSATTKRDIWYLVPNCEKHMNVLKANDRVLFRDKDTLKVFLIRKPETYKKFLRNGNAKAYFECQSVAQERIEDRFINDILS